MSKFFFGTTHNSKILNNHLLNRVIRRNYCKSKAFAYKAKRKKITLNFTRLNFELLLIFYKIVLYGSIKSTAESLHMSQPAVSLALQKLEREVGYLLFRHSQFNKSIKLTHQGIVTFNYLSRLFSLIEENSKFSTFVGFEEKSINLKINNKYLSYSILKSLTYVSWRNINISNPIKKFKLLSFHDSNIINSNIKSYLRKINLKFLLKQNFNKNFKLTNLIMNRKVILSKNNYKFKLHKNHGSVEIYEPQAFYLGVKLNISSLSYVN
jgi:hypothetical protein